MKRANEKQITKDDADEDQEGEEVDTGEFAKADALKISQRRIRKVKKGPKADTNSDAPNPFMGVTLTTGAADKPSPEIAAPKDESEAIDYQIDAGRLLQRSFLLPGKMLTQGHEIKRDSVPKEPVDSAKESAPAVEEPGPVTATGTGFASFAAGTSPFKQLSQDSVATAEDAGGATPCSQDSVYTPPTTRTETPCPSAPLRKSSTRAFASPSGAVKAAMNSGMANFGGSSAFKLLAEEGASVFNTSEGNAHGFGSPAVFGNGMNGSGPKTGAQAWSNTAASPLEQKEKEDDQDGVNSIPGMSASHTPTITGEESEETVFSHEAALFALENGSWKNRGKADLRVNASKDGGAARLLMRRRGTLTVFFNAWIYKSMKMSKMGADSCTFTCVNGAEETSEEQSPSMKVYAIRFPVKGERANMLMSEFLKVVEQFQTES